MSRFWRVPAAFAFGAALLFVRPVNSAPGVGVDLGDGLAAHRAVYTMSLGSMRAGSEVVGANGVMVMSIEHACDGWVSAQRIGLTLLDREGNEVSTEANYSSWESLDGKRYRFVSQSKHNGVVTEETKGDGHIDDGAGSVVYELPGGKRTSLPKGTLFPTRHLVELIGAARRGERAFMRPLFDGIGTEGVVDVNTVILTPLTAADAPALASPLLRRPGWHVQLAYFSRDKETSSPDYEMSAGLLDNGITQSMNLDYGGFSVDAVLKDLAELPGPKC